MISGSRLAAGLVLCALHAAGPAHAEAPAAGPGPATAAASVSGRVVDARDGKGIGNARVSLAAGRIEARADEQGAFSIEGLPPGAHDLVVEAEGYVPLVVRAGAGREPLDVALSALPRLSEALVVGAGERDPFALQAPASILAGQDLALRGAGSLGGTLAAQPGIAERSFGPAPSRPVVRGLDGDRVLVLQDGQSTGDLSSQSADHGVTLDPASAASIEIVRGPATLLHGPAAIGGLVNVVSEKLPVRGAPGTRASILTDLGSGSRERGLSGSLGHRGGGWAAGAHGRFREAGDVRTPLGPLANSASRAAGGGAGVGRVWDAGHLTARYELDDARYGIPVVEEGLVSITPRRHAADLEGELRPGGGAFETVRATLALRRYRHGELEGDEVGTTFANDQADARLLARHRPVGPLRGSFGLQALHREFSATGVEALSPPVTQRELAAFAFEEVPLGAVTLQAAARLDHARYRPDGDLPPRDFTELSLSLGAAWTPREDLALAASLSRAARRPALEELYFYGLHIGNFAFEVGSADLESEHALGFDASLRWRGARGSAEIALFHNSIGDFVFRDPTGEEVEGFPVYLFVGADSRLSGGEASASWRAGRGFTVEAAADAVRGSLRDGRPLPRIPPARLRLSLRWQRGAMQAGGELLAVARQDRVFGAETPTAGYATGRLFASWSFRRGPALLTATARLENVGDVVYRNHLSFIKDLVPSEAGRTLRVSLGARF